MRGLFATLLVLAGLVGAILVFRSALINRLAPSFLSRAGLQEATFHLKDISTNHVSIDYATGLLPLDKGAVQVSLAQVEYDFSFGQVLAGKVERLKIGRVELSLPDWKSGPAEDAAQAPQAFSLAQVFQFLENIKTLPLEALRIENLVLHAGLNGQEFSSPDLLLDYTSSPKGGSLLVREHVKRGQESAFVLKLDLTGKKLEVGLDIDLADLQSWLPHNVQAFLPLDQGRLQVQALVNHLVNQEEQELRTVHLSAQGKNVGHAASGRQAERLALNVHAESPPASEDLLLASASRLEVQGLKAGEFQLDSGILPLQGTMRFSPDSLQIGWQPAQALQLKGLRLETMRLAALTADNIAAQIHYAFGPQQQDPAKGKSRIVLDPTTRLELKQLTAPGLQLAGLQTSLPLEVVLFQNRQELRWQPSAPLGVKGLKTGTTAFAPLNVRNIDLHLQQNPEKSLVQADFLLSEIDGAFHLNWQRKAADGANQLALQTKKPLSLAPDTSLLGLLAQPPPALSAVAVEQGDLGAELRLNWGKAPMTARLDLDLRNAAASHANIRYSGLSLKHSLQLLPQLRSVQAGKLTLAAIEGPIRLEDLVARVQLLPSSKKGAMPALLIQDGSLHVFDGKVQASQCRYDLSRSSNTCSFSLHNLDLAAILALHQVDGLEVSGRINGTVPVRHDKGGFSVADGSLANAGSGVIHYQPSSEALKSSPYSEYVLKALEDYRYHSLAASLTYQPDGTLIVGLQLQGKSPELETNRPVHLNLRAEQNLLSLLKSLQYSQGLTFELNRRVQERFQPNQAQ